MTKEEKQEAKKIVSWVCEHLKDHTKWTYTESIRGYSVLFSEYGVDVDTGSGCVTVNSPKHGTVRVCLPFWSSVSLRSSVGKAIRDKAKARRTNKLKTVSEILEFKDMTTL